MMSERVQVHSFICIVYLLMYEGLFTAVFSQRSELVLDVLVLNLLGRDDSHVLPPYYSLLHEV